MRQRPARAPRRRPATSPPCRGTGSRRPATRTRGSPARPPRSSVISPCAKRAPIVCTLPASSPSSGGSVTPPGTSTHGRSRIARERHHHRGQALVAGGDAEHARAASGSERISRRKTMRRVVAVRQAVDHARRALRAAVARVGDRSRRTARHSQALQLLGGRLHQQADLPVAGVVAERDRRAVRRAEAALGARGSGTPGGRARRGFQPMPTFWVQPNRSPLGASRSISAVSGRLPAGPAPIVWTSRSPAVAERRRSRRTRWRSVYLVVRSSRLLRGLSTPPPASVHGRRDGGRPTTGRRRSARSARASGRPPLPASRSWKSRSAATPPPPARGGASRMRAISSQPVR